MVQFNTKQTPRKYWFLIGLFAMTVVFSVVNHLSTYSNSTFKVTPTLESIKVRRSFPGGVKDQITLALTFNATYADIPAPTLEWEEMAAAPVGRLDGGSAQIGNLLYVFAGYENINHVHSHVDVFNFSDNTWGDRFDMPKEMANSHLGIANDGRYVYIISGQYGAQCRPSTSRSFVLDTKTRKWSDFISLPFPRYAPPTQIWRGRLHVMGGGKENRFEIALEHWSIGVKDGKAIEKEWRSELPIPRGGPHRACVVANDRLFVFGGQEGDFMPKPGSPIFKCSRKIEAYIAEIVVVNFHFSDSSNSHCCCEFSQAVHSDVYMLEGDGSKWKQLGDMPKPNSHFETSWVIVNSSIIIIGGSTRLHPLTKKMNLIGEVFRFRLDTLEWSVIGRMPFRVKTTVAGFWNGWLYFSSGQRDTGPLDPKPKKIVGTTFRTQLRL